MRRKFSSLMIYFVTGQEEEFKDGEIEVNSDFLIIYLKEPILEMEKERIQDIVETEVEYVINLKLVNMFKILK